MLTKANLDHLYTKIRDEKTDNTTFRKYAKRIMTVVCEEALGYVSPMTCVVKTPVDDYEYEGKGLDYENMVAVSIIRAADSMLDCFMNIVPECSVGKDPHPKK